MSSKENQAPSMSVEEMRELASQLGNPSGNKGIEVGNMMNETNISMTRKAIGKLGIRDHDTILELGHGNGHHIKELLDGAKNLKYQGLDISTLMTTEAASYCLNNNLESQTKFQLYDGVNVPFADNSFDKIFTVNTIYFWNDSLHLLNELHRVLKPDGICCIAFVDERTMNTLPFTAYGFTKYNKESFTSLVARSSFRQQELELQTEMIKTKFGSMMERNYYAAVLARNEQRN
jgi:ubiquinone/menaquinone biosynthesis C-methylase UbiE